MQTMKTSDVAWEIAQHQGYLLIINFPSVIVFEKSKVEYFAGWLNALLIGKTSSITSNIGIQ